MLEETLTQFSYEDVEEALLGALLIDDETVIRVIDILKPDDFLKKENQIVYQVILDLFEKRIGIDLVTVSHRLKEKNLLEEIGGHPYLVYLIHKAPSVTNVVSYARIIKTQKARRDLLELSRKIQELIQDSTKGAEELIDETEKRIFSIAERVYPFEFTSISSLISQSLKRIEDLQKGITIRGLPTGFPKLDEFLGGLQKSDLIILASRPSQGKTALALNIARYLAVQENIPVGIFSLEMSKDQVIDRLLAAEAGVSLWKLRTGRLISEGDVDELALIYEAAERLNKAPIFIDDTPNLTNLQIRTMSRRLKHEIGELGLVIIDYLQLVRASRIIENRVQEVSEISKSLKELARELDIPVLAISQLSRAPEQRVSQIPRLSDLRESGCLTGDTLIIRADTGERIPIKNLVGQANIPIFSVGPDYKLHIKKITKVFYSGRKVVYELKTRSGRKIKASANHPFLRIDGWKRLDELKIGDYIALPRILVPSNPSNPLSEDELILLAHLLGDGCILPNQPFHYTSKDLENIEIVKMTAKKLFNIEGRLVKQKNWYHLYLPSPYHTTHKKNHPITIWFKNLGLKLVRSYEKKIPEVLFQCDENKISLFLKHLWSTDGNLSWKLMPKRKPSADIYYSTSSPLFAEQVQSLLLRLGIQSTLREIRSKKGYRPMYHVYIENSQEKLKFLYKVGIFGEKKKLIFDLINALQKIEPNPNVDIIPKIAWNLFIEPAKEVSGITWREFCQKINTAYCGSTLFKHNIGRERMLRIASVLPQPILYNLATSDIFWDKVVSIKKLGIEDVYDATVEETHNFVANDIIVHNSLEQDSDLVIFIHRPKEAGTNLPSNQVNIIIAKHRNGPIGSVDLYFDPETVSFYSLETQPEEIEFY